MDIFGRLPGSSDLYSSILTQMFITILDHSTFCTKTVLLAPIFSAISPELYQRIGKTSKFGRPVFNPESIGLLSECSHETFQ